MSNEWQHGICGCFDNFTLCIATWLVPCYTFGKTAEGAGEDCLKCGIFSLIPLLNLVAMLKVRGKIREQKGISGSVVGDLAMICCCGLCALVQEAQEVGFAGPCGESMARE